MEETQGNGWMGFNDYNLDLDVELFGGRNGIVLADMVYEKIRDKISVRPGSAKSTLVDRSQKYIDFIAFHEKHSVNARDFDRDCTQKRRSLILHFPGRFSIRGNQSINEKGYDCAQIGSLYNAMLQSAYSYSKRK